MVQTKGETPGLDALRERVKQWRASCGGKRARVPEAIWSAAVDAAQSAGPWATSKATGLNYRSLAERMGAVAQKPPHVDDVGAAPADATSPFAFLEVAMPATRSGDVAGKTVVELEGGGKRLRIETTGALDVVGLAQAFWRDARCSN